VRFKIIHFEMGESDYLTNKKNFIFYLNWTNLIKQQAVLPQSEKFDIKGAFAIANAPLVFFYVFILLNIASKSLLQQFIILYFNICTLFHLMYLY